MEKKNIVFIALALAVAAVLLYLLIPGERADDTILLSEGESLVEAPTERNWSPDTIGPPISLHTDLVDSTYHPENLQIINETLYLVDYDLMKIQRYDLEGNHLRSYGGGKGRGPGEFQHISDFTVFRSDTLLALDVRKREMIVFSVTSGELLATQTVTYRPSEVIGLGNRLLLHTLLSPELFSTYSSNLEELSTFGTIAENQVQNSIALSGNLVTLRDGNHFVFSPSRTSFLFYFDSEGTEVRRVMGPDRIGLQESITRQSGDVRVTGPLFSQVQFFDLEIYGRHLAVSGLKRGEDGALEYTFLDLYDLPTGAYRKSVRTPTLATGVALSEGRIYYSDLNEGSVKAFDFSF